MATPANASAGVSAERFGWPLARLACSVHESLPWNGSDVEASRCVPIDHSWGERHLWSLLAQYAAHQAFLSFAGLPDSGFVAEEWTVWKGRGGDLRLVRIASRGEGDWSGETGYDRVGLFSRTLGISGFASLERPWGRPDHVYAEVRRHLLEGQPGRLGSVARASCGAILSPGPDRLDAMLNEPSLIGRNDAASAARNLARLTGRTAVTIGGEHATPLAPGSGMAFLENLIPGLRSRSPELIVETLGSRSGMIYVVESPERLDQKTRIVIDKLQRDLGVPVIGDEGAEPRDAHARIEEPSRFFLISPSSESMRRLATGMGILSGSRQISHVYTFCESAAYDRFLESGELDPQSLGEMDLPAIGEPARSFLAALALLGREIDLELASRFLGKIGALVTPLDLARDGLSSVENGMFRFRCEDLRLKLERLVPPEMIEPLSLAALELLGSDRPQMRFALARRIDRGNALTILAEGLDAGALTEQDAREALRRGVFTIDELRSHASLAILEAEAMFAKGAYRTALDVAREIDHEHARYIAARACRRLGRYTEALALLAGTERSVRTLTLTGVLNRLQGSLDVAAEVFELAAKLDATDEQEVRLSFERALLSIDRFERPGIGWKRKAAGRFPWLVDRFDAYLAITNGHYEAAAESAARAIESAPELYERIDAHVDLAFADFMAGSWDRAADTARRVLRLVEETEGDRAGGGLLYILGYLSADAGRWTEAESILCKLENFYEENDDERRRRELDLIRAQLALGRLDYGEARRAASRVEQCDASEIRYAARLVLDEVDWIMGSLPIPRVDGRTKCRELQARSELVRARAGQEATLEGFRHSLFQMEQAALEGRELEIPKGTSGAENLMLIRSLDALGRRTGSSRFEEPLEALCASARIDRRTETERYEQRLLMALARVEMPPPNLPLAGIEWRFAIRNRLGAWRQYGSLPPLETSRLDTLPVGDEVLRIGESGALWLEGEIEWTDELREAVASLWRIRWEHRNLMRLSERASSTIHDDVPAAEDGIIGESIALREALRPMGSAARSNLAVTIEGESGTGKELVARAIHRRSRRRSRPFTAVNCGALPENLIESELFGHVRGAFTGAERDRTGLIEATDGGTLFLDEIGELPLAAQAKLLRFLQEGEVRRVGETVTRTADVRVIAATNRELEREVDEGRFRQDLYYRIKGIEITLPPLRRRGHDVMLLARKFLSDARAGSDAGPIGFTEEVEALFLGYGWAGNVRDLQNVVLGAFSLAGDARLITIEHLPQRVRDAAARGSKRGSYYEELAQFRRHLIEQSLVEAGGNQSRAARSLGMTRQALAYQIKELGIQVRK